MYVYVYVCKNLTQRQFFVVYICEYVYVCYVSHRYSTSFEIVAGICVCVCVCIYHVSHTEIAAPFRLWLVCMWCICMCIYKCICMCICIYYVSHTETAARLR